MADVGVLIPIATALIVANGLSATAVLLPAGLLYLGVAFTYRLPVPVQPLKAFGAIAIAQGLGADEIAAGALWMGVIFLVLGRAGLIDAAARFFPKPVIRGVQLTVGLLFLKVAWGLLDDPPATFVDDGTASWILLALGAGVLFVALTLKHRLASLVLVVVALVVVVARTAGDLELGPAAMSLPDLSAATFWTALTVLVIPQIPLTFANSCVAASDAARVYYGPQAAARVTPGRLATTLGVANLFSGSLSGMPVCHGAGGMTAHHAFGARSAGAPLIMGSALVVLALLFGAGLAAQLAAFPLPILAGLLAAAGVLHLGLLRDLETVAHWALALLVGAIGFQFNLAIAVGIGLCLWWVAPLVVRSGGGPVEGSS